MRLGPDVRVRPVTMCEILFDVWEIGREGGLCSAKGSQHVCGSVDKGPCFHEVF